MDDIEAIYKGSLITHVCHFSFVQGFNTSYNAILMLQLQKGRALVYEKLIVLLYRVLIKQTYKFDVNKLS